MFRHVLPIHVHTYYTLQKQVKFRELLWQDESLAAVSTRDSAIIPAVGIFALQGLLLFVLFLLLLVLTLLLKILFLVLFRLQDNICMQFGFVNIYLFQAGGKKKLMKPHQTKVCFIPQELSHEQKLNKIMHHTHAQNMCNCHRHMLKNAGRPNLLLRKSICAITPQIITVFKIQF